MGYELHITRRTEWQAQGPPSISESEWEQAIAGDIEADAFYWFEGNISVKNPDSQLIEKMVRIADRLGVKVQGDDGELYREDATSYRTTGVTLTASPRGILARLIAFFRPRTQQTGPGFRVGQRVKDILGGEGIVTFVDRYANGGLGSVRVKMDDGREQNRACIASGFEILR